MLLAIDGGFNNPRVFLEHLASVVLKTQGYPQREHEDCLLDLTPCVRKPDWRAPDSLILV